MWAQLNRRLESTRMVYLQSCKLVRQQNLKIMIKCSVKFAEIWNITKVCSDKLADEPSRRKGAAHFEGHRIEQQTLTKISSKMQELRESRIKRQLQHKFGQKYNMKKNTVQKRIGLRNKTMCLLSKPLTYFNLVCKKKMTFSCSISGVHAGAWCTIKLMKHQMIKKHERKTK